MRTNHPGAYASLTVRACLPATVVVVVQSSHLKLFLALCSNLGSPNSLQPSFLPSRYPSQAFSQSIP